MIVFVERVVFAFVERVVFAFVERVVFAFVIYFLRSCFFPLIDLEFMDFAFNFLLQAILEMI